MRANFVRSPSAWRSTLYDVPVSKPRSAPRMTLAYSHPPLFTIPTNNTAVAVVALLVARDFCYDWFIIAAATGSVVLGRRMPSIHSSMSPKQFCCGLPLWVDRRLTGTRSSYVPLVWLGFASRAPWPFATSR